ncbi:bacillithiol biosynthesis cysteine-adding enzyme BshC [Flavimarina sp. Hel_I_48]|uniref:bacillithiol biosynthesis cysteine-adding enzyme BshC n=1 Tax=Flavimarina sp. Hel_I_48 TaxID=1392488 RepID=UPI0004DED723|nr:bacillithiol biosynthesis cysteine-adding enzyme BshC [Flavimarina sp. Hel_I_48]
MNIHKIPYSETGYFSKIICDYLEKKESITSFYHRSAEIESFKAQIKEKKSFTAENRQILVKTLQNQYKSIKISQKTAENIDLLEKDSTFTITTGHQLNLFTGPLYFLYKIIHTITLSQKLKSHYPEQDFVPVYWMATEDHDFDEINYFNLNGKKFRWNRTDITDNNKGAVGELFTEGLDAVHEQFCAEIGSTRIAKKLCNLFSESYLEHKNLTEATRYLANELFAEYGLVIIDANAAALKRNFIPFMERELKEQISFKTVEKTTEKLEKSGYSIQVSPREINLFYLKDGLRERIIERDGAFFVHDTQMEFSQEEILKELQNYPERFSPNVIMRPLYQEVILPNLCYIGGGGELAYWLELKDYFEAVQVPFPILMLRNSALIMTEKQFDKAKKMDLEIADLFQDNNDLVNRRIRKISNIDIDFSPQKEHLINQFEEMYTIAEKTDVTFLGAVKAQEVKQLKGLDHLEKRLLKAQKRKLGDEVKRLTALQLELFPRENLQERINNFSEFYIEYGEKLIPQLMESLDPLNEDFSVIVFE